MVVGKPHILQCWRVYWGWSKTTGGVSGSCLLQSTCRVLDPEQDIVTGWCSG